MTDRELLEMGAKAAGLNVKAERVDADDKFTHLIVGAKNTRERITWNPLTDNGDALRLAVKLQMEIAIFQDECHTRCIEHGQRDWHDAIGADPYAATRRAIVRAAAEIGKATP